MHDCAASFSRQNIVEILSFHLWGVYYGRSEGGARDGYAGHHLRALQSWPTNRSTHLKDWSCHRSGLYYESGDGFLLQQFFWVCYHLQYHAGAKPPPKLLITCRKFLLIYNNFVGSNSFLTKLSLKVQNIEPIKLVYILTSKCQNMMSQLLTSFIPKI